MFNFSAILINLQATIAAHAARNRALTVLLVAVWGRIARMGTRLERLVRLWRAGKVPVPRAPRPGRQRGDTIARIRFPTAPAWLLRRMGYEVAAYGSQLQHLLSEADCAAFLAAVPQAGRILRPLFHMLGVSPVPEAVRRRAPPSVVVRPVARASGVEWVSMVIAPGPIFASP